MLLKLENLRPLMNCFNSAAAQRLKSIRKSSEPQLQDTLILNITTFSSGHNLYYEASAGTRFVLSCLCALYFAFFLAT